MQRTLQIILEIVKRPYLWNIETPDATHIAEVLVEEKVYKNYGCIKDQAYAVGNYLEVILEMKRIMQCQNSK